MVQFTVNILEKISDIITISVSKEFEEDEISDTVKGS